MISVGGPVKLAIALLFLLYGPYTAGGDDRRDVMSAVVDLAGRWQDLGISLGVRQSNLDEIDLASAHSPRDCLRKMLITWLRKAYNVRTSLISKSPHFGYCLSGLVIGVKVECSNFYPLVTNCY